MRSPSWPTQSIRPELRCPGYKIPEGDYRQLQDDMRPYREFGSTHPIRARSETAIPHDFGMISIEIQVCDRAKACRVREPFRGVFSSRDHGQKQ